MVPSVELEAVTASTNGTLCVPVIVGVWEAFYFIKRQFGSGPKLLDGLKITESIVLYTVIWPHSPSPTNKPWI
jgi:hypothetical protein